MKYPNLLRAAVIAVTLGAGSVLAQTAPSPAPSETAPHASPPVVSDVGPRPAEDRSSTGAIVLEDSLVRAQREQAFERSASRTGVASVGRGVLRATQQAKTEAELAQLHFEEGLELRRKGAGSLTEK